MTLQKHLKAITEVRGNTELFVTYQLEYLSLTMATENPLSAQLCRGWLMVFLIMLSEIQPQNKKRL